MSGDDNKGPTDEVVAEEGENNTVNDGELQQLQEKVSSLTSKFATSYAGLVGNLSQSVSMMQRINGIMEAYVTSALQMSVTLRSAPSSCAVRIVNRCQFALHDLVIVVALMNDDEEDGSPVSLTRLRSNNDRFWRIADLLPATDNNTEVESAASVSCHYAMPSRRPTSSSIVIMARFPSPASGQQLESRVIVPLPIVCQLSRTIAHQSHFADPSLSLLLSHNIVVEGDRWRRLFAISPMRGINAVHDWFGFALHDDHTAVVAECRVVAHDLTKGDITVELRGARAHEALTRTVLRELSATNPTW